MTCNDCADYVHCKIHITEDISPEYNAEKLKCFIAKQKCVKPLRSDK